MESARKASHAKSCFVGPCASDCCEEELRGNDVRSVAVLGDGNVDAIVTGYGMESSYRRTMIWFAEKSDEALTFSQCAPSMKFAVGESVKFATSSLSAVTATSFGILYASGTAGVSFSAIVSPNASLAFRDTKASSTPPSSSVACSDDSVCAESARSQREEAYEVYVWGSAFWFLLSFLLLFSSRGWPHFTSPSLPRFGCFSSTMKTTMWRHVPT